MSVSMCMRLRILEPSKMFLSICPHIWVIIWPSNGFKIKITFSSQWFLWNHYSTVLKCSDMLRIPEAASLIPLLFVFLFTPLFSCFYELLSLFLWNYHSLPGYMEVWIFSHILFCTRWVFSLKTQIFLQFRGIFLYYL